MKTHCSPFRQVTSKITCLSLTELRLIAKDYNETSTTIKKIKLSQNKADLYNEIRTRLETFCNEESCWIDQDFVKNEHRRKLEKSFRPRTPLSWYKNRKTWLNTFDILHVMKQYEELHKTYSFIGVFPIDFQNTYSSGACIGKSLCTFDVAEFLKSKKKQFGVVLNLDDHTQSGSHWVALFCNLDPQKENFGIYYYDSVAQRPGREVSSFFNQIKTQVATVFTPQQTKAFQTKYNTIQKQFKNTECGVFSMIFITQMLKNVPFDEICRRMKNDDQVNEIRDVLYRPNVNGLT